MTRIKRNWYCYVCGGTIEDVNTFHLMTPSDHTDRVFLAHDKCKDRADDAYLMKVRELKDQK